jgi:hypothetical protein
MAGVIKGKSKRGESAGGLFSGIVASKKIMSGDKITTQRRWKLQYSEQLRASVSYAIVVERIILLSWWP